MRRRVREGDGAVKKNGWKRLKENKRVLQAGCHVRPENKVLL